MGHTITKKTNKVCPQKIFFKKISKIVIKNQILTYSCKKHEDFC